MWLTFPFYHVTRGLILSVSQKMDISETFHLKFNGVPINPNFLSLQEMGVDKQ